MIKRLPVLFVVLVLAVWLGNLVVRNFLAASLIAYGESGETREKALDYSPSNPAVIAARGKYLLYRAEPPQTDAGIRELLRATSRSLSDYRYWLELGRAFENVGDSSRAEISHRRAVELAPRYFDARWAYANFLLRAGNAGQANREFREAILFSGCAAPDEKAVFNIYNAVVGESADRLDPLYSVTPPGDVPQALLARFLISRHSLPPAIDIWLKLPNQDTPEYRMLTADLMRNLQANGRFLEAGPMWRAIELLAKRLPNTDGTDRMINGGFEQPPAEEIIRELADPPAGYDWFIRKHTDVRVRRTNFEKHGGAYSLHLAFSLSMGSDLDSVWQTIRIMPGERYRLRFFVKYRNVPENENDAPFVEITDAMKPERLAVKSYIPSGSGEWSERAIEFTAPADTEGLRLKIGNRRVYRVDPSRVTEVWFDDFKLEKAGP
jgi:hypothetical protein